MRECTIISKFTRLFCIALLTSSFLVSSLARAQSGPAIPGAPPSNPTGLENVPQPESGPGSVPSGRQKEDTGLFDQSSPYLEYGDFNMAEEENEDALYFQYGRFFGLSLGLGYQTATGNRGKLYEPAIPRFDIRIHYWFSFNFAMDLGVFFANHSFTYAGSDYQTKLIGYGIHLKYYFDVKDSSAALTFANPFIEGGAGAWSFAQTQAGSTQPDSDSTLSIDVGGGLEFPIVHKKTYFILEALYHTQNFVDSKTNDYIDRVPNLDGGFFTLMGHFMFVW